MTIKSPLLQRLLPLLVFLFFLLSPATYAAPADATAEAATGEAVELLNDSDQLIELLSPSQRLKFFAAERMVAAGESDKRRGDFMGNRQPSGLNPDEDLSDVHERGERLIEQGQAKIEEGHAEMLRLLRIAKTELEKRSMTNETVFDVPIKAAGSYERALRATASRVLRGCWEAGYDTIFYDRVFATTETGTEEADLAVRNASYDTLISVDGTRFSVTAPSNLEFDPKNEKAVPRQFTFDDSDSFGKEKIALLTIERVAFGPASSQSVVPQALEAPDQTNGDDDASDHEQKPMAEPERESIAHNAQNELLIVQAFDINSLELIAKEVQWILPGSGASVLPRMVTLTEIDDKIQLLSALPEPYAFRIESQAASPEQAILFESALTHLLLENSDLRILPSSYLLRITPTEDRNKLRALKGMMNASIVLQSESEGAGGRYSIKAVADGSDRSLRLGRIEASAE